MFAYNNRAAMRTTRRGRLRPRHRRLAVRRFQLDPKYARAYNNRGNTYSTTHDYDRAIADFSEAIRLDPKYALAYRNRGLSVPSQG